MVRLTRRGSRLVAASAVVALLGLIFGDYFMLAAPAAVALLLALDAVSAWLRARGAASTAVEPAEARVRMRAGDAHEVRAIVRAPVRLEVDGRGWVRVSQSRPATSTEVVLTISPRVSGVYRLDCLIVRVSGRLQLLEAAARLPFSLEVKAYPRALPWIVEAGRILQAGGAGGPGLAPGRRRGVGTEYDGTREYVPGDSLRLIDWKATARLAKLMVKEFLEDVYGAAHIIYDARAPGPSTADELATLFLSTAVGLASLGVPAGLTIKSGRELVFHGESLRPLDVLEVALAHVLETYRVDLESVYELIDPKPAREVVRVLERARARGLARLYRFAREKRMHPSLKRLIGSHAGRLDVVYVGHVLYDAAALLEIADEAKLRGHRLHVLAPKKPWLDARNLEEAYTTYVSFKRVLSSLSRVGADVKLGLSAEPPTWV